MPVPGEAMFSLPSSELELIFGKWIGGKERRWWTGNCDSAVVSLLASLSFDYSTWSWFYFAFAFALLFSISFIVLRRLDCLLSLSFSISVISTPFFVCLPVFDYVALFSYYRLIEPFGSFSSISFLFLFLIDANYSLRWLLLSAEEEVEMTRLIASFLGLMPLTSSCSLLS